MTGLGYAVLDFETTGVVAKFDRVVEVAVVHVSPAGEITGAWDSLVNPQRDMGAQHIHGIRARDAAGAPTFAEIAPQLLELLDGRVLVAHNASFDLRFLIAELTRAGYPAARLQDAPVLCTMLLAPRLIPGAGRRLEDCCDAFGIDIDGQHMARADAWATAQLLGAYLSLPQQEIDFRRLPDIGADFHWPKGSDRGGGEWRSRGAVAAAQSVHFLQRISHKLPELGGPGEQQDYFAMLDRFLVDRELSLHEQESLVALANELSLSRATCEQLHLRYFESVVAAAWSDGQLTADELADLAKVGQLLSLEPAALSAAVQPPTASARADAAALAPTAAFRLEPGALIVLTGEMRRPRPEWEATLTDAGFVVWPAVTKKVHVVFAADPDSLSGKARKARDYGIPVHAEHMLERLLG